MAKRTYDSSRRAARAAATRRRIIDSLAELVGDRALRDVTVADIAAGAEVSEATVYAIFGTKPAVAAALVEAMEEDAVLADRIPALMAETDPARKVERFVSLHVDIFAGGAAILRTLSAARGEPEVRDVLAHGDANRRAGLVAVVEGLHAQAALAPGLDVDGAVDRAWLLTSVSQFLLATDELGWTPTRYRTWLTALLRRELLGDPAQGDVTSG